MALSKNRTLDLLRESYYSNYSKYNLQGSIKSPATKSVVFKDDEEKKKKENTFWQDTGDFFEGVGYLGHKAGLGFINSLEGTVDYLSSGIAKLFGADALAEKILENDWLDYDAADDWFNPGQGWKIAGDVAGGIGTSLFSIGTGLFTGGAGVVISAGLSGAGNAARESYKESGKYGLNEFLYSSSVGALEGGLEAVLGAGTKWAKSLAKSMGLSIGKNAAKNAGKVVATTAKSALKKAGTEMFSEGMEEAITEFVSPYIKRVTYDKNAANATADEILYAGLVGGLSGLVMSGSVGAINQAGNIRKGNAIVKDGRASSVASLAETLVNVDKNSKYNKAIDDIYNRIAPAVNSGEKLNLNQRRALGELLQLETAAVFEPVIKRSAISVINSAEAVATRLNEYGTYKIVDGKLVNVKDSSFDISGAEVRDITAEDITRGVVFENEKRLDTQSVDDALQNNDVLRLVSASDAAGRLMMNAKETERAASFGSKIRSQEELMAFVAESTPEEKAALAKELQIEDLDSVGFEEFNQKALEYRESGKAEQFQERIRTKEQLQRLSVDNAKRMPIEIHLADGEMKRYSDGDSNISVVRNGNEYIVYDFKNGTLSQPLTKKRLDKILQRKKQIKKTQASDDKALALYEEKLQKKYDKDAPLREARARILAQMGVREETTVPNLNPDAKPQMNGVAPANIKQNVAQNENAESNADLNTVTQSDASPYENYTNNEFSENAGKKSRGLMPLLESIADSFSGIGSSGGKTKSLRSVPSDERGAVMQPASETEADTTKNEDIRSNEKGEIRSLLGVDAAKKFAESINAYRNAKNIAQEKIADFDKMDDSKKEKTVSVLKNAVKKGVSAEDATMYARVSARSGLDIVFDKEACLRKVNGEEVYAAGFYDPENNRIVVNPDAKKKHASLLIHELSHAIRSYVGKDNKIHYISDKNAKISDELWEKVKKHYSDQNVEVTRMELMLDEASAYYAEEILGTDAAIDLLLGKKKTLKEKILSFFKGAARDYAGDAKLSKEARKFLRTFKKMFDAFADKNQSVKAEKSEGDESAKRFAANIEDFASSHDISWRNVAYEDSETKAKITSDIHNKMVAEGLIVKIPDEIKSKVKESYPDLQGMKKKERLPILKDSIKQLKTNLRTFLTKLKGNTFEFEVDGDVLEAKLYNVGIDEVLEKVTQDKAEMLYTTEEIFKNSRYLYSTPDYDGDPNIYRWNYFYSPVQLGENIVGVRIAIRDMVKQGESQIYNWGIKKDTSLGGVRDDYINRKSNDASSDVSSDIIIPDSEPKSNSFSENSSKNSSSDTKTRRYSMDEEPKLPRSAGTMSIGQYKQRVADLTKTKSYMKNQVYDIVKKLPMSDMASEKTRMQVTEAVWQIFNEQQTAGERQKAVHDISQFLVARLMTEAKVDNPEVRDANEKIAYLRTGIGNLAFSPEDMKEIQHNVDNDGLRRILGRWGFKGKKNADGTLQGVRTPMEVFVTDIAREMPGMAHLENMHPVEAFLEIDALYTRVKETAAEKKISAFSYMSDEDIESLTKSIEECITEAYSQGGGKSVFMKRVEQGVSYYEERAAKYKEEFDEIKGRDKIHGLLMNQAQKMKDLKLGRFSNITEGSNEVFKNTIGKLASIQWRGNISDTNAKKAIKDLYAWYTSAEVKENLFCVTKEDDGLWQQSVAEMMEELAKDESKGFSKTELYALLDVLTYFTHFTENFGKVWFNGEWSDAKELATNFIQVAQNQSTVKHKWYKDLARGYLNNFGDPATVVRMMDQYQDGFFTEIFEKLRDSAISARSAELDILSEYNEFLKKNKRYVQNASEQTVKYRGVDIPKMHLISLYMTMKRKHAYAGVAINGFQFKNSNGDIVRIGGFLDPDAVYSEQEIESYIRKERGEIEKLLTDTDKQYISILEKGYNVDAKRLKADRDIQRFGMTNATSDYYYPLRRANRAQKMDSDVATEIDRVSSASFNKETVKGAKQELFIESADALFNRHVHAVCQYAYLTPVLDMQKVLYNKDISGNPNHPVSIRTETQNIWPEGFQYFRDMLSDVQGIQRSSSSKFLSSVRGNYAKFQLGANPKTWFTQLSSFLAATSVLDASSVLRGIGMSGKGFDRYSKLARIRVADNAAANAQGVLDNKAKRATNAVGDALMAPIGMMDKFVVSKLFGACQVQIQKDGGAKIGTEENKIEAGKLLTRVILESQQNSIETERSSAMRSGNEFYRTLTMFRSDSMKTIGRVIDGFGEVSALRRILKSKEMSADTRTEMQARLKRAKKKTAKASVALISSSVFMALLAQAFRWLYAKEKEEEKEDDNMLERFRKTFAGTLLFDSLGNMIGGLPGFADMYSSIVDGYDVENYSYSAINDVLGSAKSLIDMVGDRFGDGVTAQERNRAIRDASYSLGQLLGIPTRNVYNVFAGLTKRVSKKAGYAIDNAFYEKNYKNDLEKAFENGDDDMTVYIMGLLLGERLDQSMSDDVFSEMLALSKRGYKVLPRTIPSSVTVKDENGDDVEYELTSDEQDALRLSYSEYTEGLSRLFSNAEYSRLSDEDKEAAIDYVSKLYYNMALKNVLGIERGGNSLLWSGVLGVDTFTTYRLTVNNITPDVDRQGNEIAGSKRKKTIQAINDLDASVNEKLLLICASGYAVKDGDIRGYSADRAKQTLYRTIKAMNVSEEERIKLAEACGFKVKNGRILIN